MKMKSPSLTKDYNNSICHYRTHSMVKKLLQYALYALLPIALFRLCFYPSPPPPPPDSLNFSTAASSSRDVIELPLSVSRSSSSSPSSSLISPPSPSPPPPPSPPPQQSPPLPSPPPPQSPPPLPVFQAEDTKSTETPTTTTTNTLPPSSSTTTTAVKPTSQTPTCDYTTGEWIPTSTPPLYNGTTCRTIKPGQNCILHGRPDLGYLYYRWKPHACDLPPFSPSTFLSLLRHKHLAFVGDSMARNQLESLICMLSSLSAPKLLYSRGADEFKFRRWRFPSHNLTVSGYWSPFLVKGVEKSTTGPNHNALFLDSPDEKWASELGTIDVVVLSIGHWFLHPAVYYEGGSVIGCHACDASLNHTEVEFYGVFRKAYRTALRTIVERRKTGSGRAAEAVVATFMPSHFVGEWDKVGACNMTRPYKEGEVEMDWMNAEMRKIAVEEVELAKGKGKGEGEGEVRVSVLDVTKLSLLRPDGHPGPYMHPFPFKDGVVKDRVANDCLHFCLPGPIDTWNEIMLEMIMKQSSLQQSR